MIYQKPLDLITEIDIARLVELRTGESVRLEFKDHLKLGSAKASDPGFDDQNEFLADVSAFANAQGGDLVFGVSCDRASGEAIGYRFMEYPAKQPGKDFLGTAIDNALSRLEPTLFGVQSHFLERDGKFILILRIPRSPNGPHRTPKKTFHVRHSRGKAEMDVSMLRQAFRRVGNARKRFRKIQAADLTAICAQRMELLEGFQGEPFWVLHIAPIAALSGEVLLTSERLAAHLKSDNPLLVHLPEWREWPFQDEGKPRVGFDFSGAYKTRRSLRGETSVSPAFIHFGRQGLIKVVTKAGISSVPTDRSQLITPGPYETIGSFFSDDQGNWIETLTSNLERLDLYPPYFVSLSLTQPRLVHLGRGGLTGKGRFYPGPTFEIDRRAIQPVDLKPAFDAIFNGYGLENCGWNPEKNPIGAPRE
ncbi:MAG: ATP-binding protein [Vulcanimicrobiota bacterium]